MRFYKPRIAAGYPFKSLQYSTFGIKLLKGTNVKRGVLDWSPGNVSYWNTDLSMFSKFRLKTDDVVIAMDGSLVGRSFAKLSESDLPALLLQRVARLRSNFLDQNFLFFNITSNRFIEYCDSVKTNTAVPHISPKNISEFKIPLPPTLHEQRLIARALSDADAAIAAQEALIAKKEAILQGTKQELLSGKRRLPGFSGKWEIRRLGEITDLITKGTTPTSIGGEYTSKGVNFIKIEAISRNGKILHDQLAKIDLSTHKLLSRSILKEGDILFSIAGALGRVTIVKDQLLPCNTNQALSVIRLSKDSDVTPEWLYFYLTSEQIKIHVQNINVQAAQANLSLNDVNNFLIACPYQKEAYKIIQVLTDMDAELDALRAELSKLRQIKEGMKQELLTGRTRLVERNNE